MTHPADPESPPAATPRDATYTVEQLLDYLEGDINNAVQQQAMVSKAVTSALTLALLDLKRLRSALSVSGTAPEPTPREPTDTERLELLLSEGAAVEYEFGSGKYRMSRIEPRSDRDKGPSADTPRAAIDAVLAIRAARAVAPAGSQP